jgi:hypothetical protein
MLTDAKAWEARLRKEGYTGLFIHEDVPGEHYPDHTHPTDTTHIILAGSITGSTAGTRKTYKAGDRWDVPAKTIHSALVGPRGCRFLIGRK